MQFHIMGNDVSLPTRRLVHYVHVRFCIDDSEYVHVRFFPEDISTMYQALAHMRENDAIIHQSMCTNLDALPEKLTAINPRKGDQDKCIFLAMHHDDNTKNNVRLSMIPNRTLSELQQERDLWLEPSFDEPESLANIVMVRDETESKKEKEKRLQLLREGQTPHTQFLQSKPLFKEIFKTL